MNFLVTGEFAGGGGALWLGVLLDMALKGTLLLAATFALTRLLRRDTPARRSRIWSASFALLITLPLITLAMQQAGRLESLVPWHALRPVVTVTQAGPPEIPIVDDAAGETIEAASTAVVDEAAAGDRSATMPSLSLPAPWTVVVLLWLGGAAVFMAGLLRRYRAGRAIARRADCCDDEALLALAPDSAIVFSNETDVPFLTGLRRHHLVLPEAVRRWPHERLRPIVLHELAHLRRRDLPRLILGDLVCSLYWFQPLVWLAARRSYLDLELACDRDVCASGVRGTDYARLLLTFAAGRVPATAHGAAFARPSSIEVRMRHALRPHSRRGRLAPLLSTAGAVAALVLLTSVLVQPLAETPPAAAPWALPDVKPVVETPATTTMPREITGSIHDAARDGDTRMVMTMIDRRPELLEQRDHRGMTPLAVAAWNDHVSLARLLIEKGADPDCRNTNGLTPLFCALDRGRRTMAHMLIDQGADTSVRGFEQRSLLHMAARTGARGVVDILLAEGADINDTDRRGATPLDLAAWSRYPTMADYLVSRGGEHSGLANPHAHLRVKKDIYLTPDSASLILK